MRGYEQLSPKVKNNEGTGGLEIIHYAGNPYWKANFEPEHRGAYYGAPSGSLFWDSRNGFWGGYIINHRTGGRNPMADNEAGKNVLFVDGAVRWYPIAKFAYDGPWP